jgi:hypothetical protein
MKARRGALPPFPPIASHRFPRAVGRQSATVLRAREAVPIFRMTFPSQTAGEYVERR